MARLTEPQLTALIRKHFGDLGEEVVQTMVRIARAENSALDPEAIGDNFRSGHQFANSPARYDYGLLMINGQHGYDPERLLSDPEYNIAAAREIYDRQGPQAWATFNQGIAGPGGSVQRPDDGSAHPVYRPGSGPPPGSRLVYFPGDGPATGAPSPRKIQGEFGGGGITQGFGPTDESLDGPYTDPETGETWQHFNKGVDIARPVGSEITAFSEGTVVTAGDDGTGWGTRVVVRDRNGFFHNYGHLSGVGVQPGDEVAAGDALGKSGNTGASTGPHLSYDIYTADGRYYDPIEIARAAAGDEDMAKKPKRADWKKLWPFGSGDTSGDGDTPPPGRLGGDFPSPGGTEPTTRNFPDGSLRQWNPETQDWDIIGRAEADDAGGVTYREAVNPSTGTLWLHGSDGSQWDTGIPWGEDSKSENVRIPGQGVYERDQSGEWVLAIADETGGAAKYSETDMPGVVFDSSSGQYLVAEQGGMRPLTMQELEEAQRRALGLQELASRGWRTPSGGGGAPDIWEAPGGGGAANAGVNFSATDPITAETIANLPDQMGPPGTRPYSRYGDQLEGQLEQAARDAGYKSFSIYDYSGAANRGVGTADTIAQIAGEYEEKGKGVPHGFLRDPFRPTDAEPARPFSSLDELLALLGLTPKPKPGAESPSLQDAGAPRVPVSPYANVFAGGLPRTELMTPEARQGAGVRAWRESPPLQDAGASRVPVSPYANVFAGVPQPNPYATRRAGPGNGLDAGRIQRLPGRAKQDELLALLGLDAGRRS